MTGLEPDQLAEYSQRIVDLQRAILLREGRKWSETDIPREFLFTEPLSSNRPVIVPGPDGPENITGNKLDKGKYLEMLQDFYKQRKWNPRTGQPEAAIPAVLN